MSMTESDDVDKIRDAAFEAGEEVKRSIVEAVRLADEERAKLTGQVQDDRRDDAPPERQLTTDQVQQDRLADEPTSRGNIQQDRRDDEVENRENIQQDRRDDQEPERDRTTARIREDRQADLHFTTDQIQKDRRDDEAPREVLEMVRADRLARSLMLLNSVRKMCMGVLIVMVILGFILAYMIDYMTDNRARLDDNREATEQVDESFKEFNEKNEAFIDNHQRTQRLICGWYRANNMPLPDNGDCDNR